MKAIIVCGSRSPQGQTAFAALAMLEGLQSGGADGEVVYLPQIAIERCRQCDDAGWGTCRTEGQCVIDDDFAAVVDKVRSADVTAWATPVYFSDLSESLRAFLDRLRRICRHETGKDGVDGKPAVGICVAGGGGGGAPQAVFTMNHVLATTGFDVVDVVPVRRQNLELKCELLKRTGQWLARRRE